MLNVWFTKKPRLLILVTYTLVLGGVLSVAGCSQDVTPPGPVSNFIAEAGDSKITLSWVNPSDTDLKGIRIIRKVGTAPISLTDGQSVYDGLGNTHVDMSLENGTTYFYAAYAYDTSQNYSTAVVVNAKPQGDLTPPGPVTNFTATAGDAQVTLRWTNPQDEDVAGVKILRKVGSYPDSISDGNPIFDNLGTEFVDATVSNGVEYFYAAYAYDNANNYSDPAQQSATPTSAIARQDVLDNLGEIVDLIEENPGTVLTQDEQQDLLDILADVEETYRGGDECGAASLIFQAFLPKTQEFRKNLAIELTEELYNLGRMLRYSIVTGRSQSETCPGTERLGIEPDIVVGDSSEINLAGSILFGEPIVQTILDGENPGDPETFTELAIPGVESVQGIPGMPAIPVFYRLIAAPLGATVAIDLLKSQPKIAEEISLNLYPCQEQPVDDDRPDPSVFDNKPFIKDPVFYAMNTPIPPEPVRVLSLGDGRDIQFYLVEIAAGQYNPSSDKLSLFERVEFEVQFKGGRGVFISDKTLNLFESGTPVYSESLINAQILSKFVDPSIVPNLIGEEFMILTHPNFRDAAIALRDWKRTKGIWTNVYECGTSSGVTDRQTREQIRSFIIGRYKSVWIRPSYVLLLGDAEFIEPFYLNSIGTDWPYSILGDINTDRIPDLAVGRIPVDTLEQAQIVINKIINYEKTPPTNIWFYNKATFASQFQCCRSGAAQGTDQRTFIEVSEFARNTLISAGKIVDRIYEQTGGPPPRPARYYNGTLLPAALGVGSGFEWNGTGADIISAWNEGRFLIMHRDHGWQSGWVHPYIESTNISSLNNGALLPVVFSVNCASGFFDNETAGGAYGTTVDGVYFCERLLRRQEGGAVGILGDTRNSPSWPNSVLTRGFFDAIWPFAMGTYGGTTSHRRLGDILNYGKIYLMSTVGTNIMGETIWNGDALNELYLWNCLGDPTLEIWTRSPYFLTLPSQIIFQYITLTGVKVDNSQMASGMNVEYEQNGAVITVYQEMRKELRPVGRGIVEGGKCKIMFPNAIDTTLPLQFVASYENARSRTLDATLK